MQLQKEMKDIKLNKPKHILRNILFDLTVSFLNLILLQIQNIVFCRTPVLGQGLGIDFTFTWDNNNNNNDNNNDNNDKNPHLNFLGRNSTRG